ncbi:class I SAM-dependent methyltransferase [Desulfohalobiaceae bacterium Ax17]|uniref:class I SAM-dependent methyltransferase n=1 Tax=Desulfovulcanus ferrireducens TaxID=2831190 RepID=UPI00207BCA40|nr:class I SAM-dependent methyltransferase [Desulfovulcanus ferrireducens]MBT8763117.1 class I SAM-dependent methyltransferase [Desulfovulcanus ferrireducens]
MPWSDEIAEKYDSWAETRSGQFALEQEKRLIQRLVSTWPRRRQKLLELGCGTGIFLEFFWEAGFDVSGIDSSRGMLARARKRLGHRVELHLGRAEDLPFEDNEFDFVAIITVLEFCEHPETVIKEAARVARKGMVIGFLNKHSLYYLTHGLNYPGARKSLLRQARWYSWLEMRKIIYKTLGPQKTCSRSVLPGSPLFWRDCAGLKYLHKILWPPFVGSFIGMRIDLIKTATIQTPLMIFGSEPAN